MPRVEKSKEFFIQALGFPSVKEGGGEHLDSSETHLPWTSQILGGVGLCTHRDCILYTTPRWHQIFSGPHPHPADALSSFPRGVYCSYLSP